MKSSKINVFDVARYILNRRDEMSAMKLQKLVYYSQAWSLVWNDRPLFWQPIEAWVSGPVVRALYETHRGMFLLKSKDVSQGDTRNLTNKQRETIDLVLDYYGNKNSQWLSDLTHMEKPWKKARQGLAPDERSDRVITHESMGEYYSSLTKDGPGQEATI